jgi:hypothetical protein
MKRFVLFALLLVTLAACDKKRGMETKTFELGRLSNDEALALLTPYIREGGYVSGKEKLISVTEKPDRLRLIGDLLKQYDGGGEAFDIALDVQVIEANGFESADPAIADIESTLRQMFKYRGYKLIGSTRIQTREDERFLQANPAFKVQGHMQRLRASGNEQRIPITIGLQTDNGEMESTVTATLGKPVVLGQSTVQGGAVILVIRPSIVSK